VAGCGIRVAGKSASAPLSWRRAAWGAYPPALDEGCASAPYTAGGALSHYPRTHSQKLAQEPRASEAVKNCNRRIFALYVSVSYPVGKGVFFDYLTASQQAVRSEHSRNGRYFAYRSRYRCKCRLTFADCLLVRYAGVIPEPQSPGLRSTQPWAYFLTFTCYGDRLHGDKRGSVDRTHNHFGSHYLEARPLRVAYETDLMSCKVVTVDAAARKTVLPGSRSVPAQALDALRCSRSSNPRPRSGGCATAA